ncbi:MAG: hypothetical protein A3A33_05085 [Candidatus Yanofskybacteria bacterium RIFCSPLOWO2_01_FULL_49_25]|uniref:Uncharacterized protein n=1 Tax=Candidatus Yanofskybacteria bacterium RIFCSPLOWO2_01_FULL_49_25 TaxID=1802701 RepID=A0A1F8GSF7_9BACT|nr:MAG: hypothetical protein A3A33_05085 [Candidatus Yanofskybacteria bacterium RIFCSPLOWO2_01_FULL_49_25]
MMAFFVGAVLTGALTRLFWLRSGLTFRSRMATIRRHPEVWGPAVLATGSIAYGAITGATVFVAAPIAGLFGPELGRFVGGIMNASTHGIGHGIGHGLGRFFGWIIPPAIALIGLLVLMQVSPGLAQGLLTLGIIGIGFWVMIGMPGRRHANRQQGGRH